MKRSRMKIKKLYKALLVCLAVSATTSIVFANPVLNNVVSGNVNIQQTSNTTVINQSSSNAIINWQSFNIGQNQSTHFQQPAGGIALNQISALQGASQIYGRLTATGQIILENPAGIFFGPSAYVNVGGLIATTAHIKTSDFLNGKYYFSGTPAGSSVINAGTILAAQHGLVALVGANVRNDGMITASLGKVALASGNAFTVDFGGDGLVNFALNDSAVKDANGKTVPGSITNTGTISVAPQAAQNVLDNSINMNGIAQATSVSQSGGEIILGGSSTGNVKVSGKLIASNHTSGGKGGKIKITGQHILVDNGAVLDASGDAGGGDIFIGGNAHGAGPLPNADTVIMMPTASINADAITSGNGGNIVLWSNDATQAYGSLSAKGGATSGNGGSIETSGSYLDVNGISVNTSAPNGLAGDWLLDPADLIISAGANSNVSGSAPFIPTGTASNLNVTTLTTALAGGDVTVQTGLDSFAGNGDIFVNTGISWSSANSLTLSAYRNITSSATITNTGGGSVALRADNTGTGTGTVSFTAGNNVALSGGSGEVSVFYNPTIFGTPQTIYTGGTAPTAFMLINTAANLQTLSTTNTLWASNFALATNIDASGLVGFTPIALGSNYSGNFNGQGFTISNLTINLPATNNIGLFSVIGASGSVSDLALSSANISGGVIGVGGIAGINNGSISNIINVTGTIQGATNLVGGIAGENTSTGSITSSNAAADVSTPLGLATNTYTGGLVGYNDSGATLTNDSVLGGSVQGSRFIGGLVGGNASIIDNTNTVATGTILGSNVSGAGTQDSLGGLAGINDVGGTIVNYTNPLPNIVLNNFNVVSGFVGGLVGTNSGTINGATVSNNVLGQTPQFLASRWYGGLAGINTATGIIKGTINLSGQVTAYRAVGGLIGENDAAFDPVTTPITINNNSIVNGFEQTGGLIGINVGTVGDASTGFTFTSLPASLTGSNQLGGLVGENDGTIQNVTLNNPGAITITTQTGGVFSPAEVGGLVGLNTGPITNAIANNVNINATPGSGFQVGGLIGYNTGTATLSGTIASSGTVSGTSQVGGLIGQNDAVLDDTGNNFSTTSTISLSSLYGGGLIGRNDGTLQNFNFNTLLYSLPDVNVTGSYVGGFVGENIGTITNSSTAFQNVGTTAGSFAIGGLVGLNLGTVSSSHTLSSETVGNALALIVGGLVGFNSNSITGSTNAATVSGNSVVGGIAGLNFGSISSFNSNSGSVSGNSNVGGIAGDNESSINFASNTGPISGTTNVGGVAGLSGFGSTISSSNVFGSNNVTGATHVGGIAGFNQGAINLALNLTSGHISGTTDVGGVAGLNQGSITASESFSDVSGNTNVGGVAGDNESSITTSFNFNTNIPGGISGALNVGGLVGYNNGSVSNGGNTSAVAGGTNVGGIIGSNTTNGTLFNLNNTGGIATGSQNVGSYIGHLVGGSGGNFSLIGGIINETFGGSTNTITGDNVPTTWTITGINTGSIGGSIGSFSNIQNLTGGTSTNTFKFIGNAAVTGTLNGGPTFGTLDYSADSNPISVIMSNLKNGIGQGFNASSIDATNTGNLNASFISINHIIGNSRGALAVFNPSTNSISSSPFNPNIAFSSPISLLLYDGLPHSLSGTISDPLDFSGFLFVFPSLGNVNGVNNIYNTYFYGSILPIDQILIDNSIYNSGLVNDDILTVYADMAGADAAMLSGTKIIPNCSGLSQSQGGSGQGSAAGSSSAAGGSAGQGAQPSNAAYHCDSKNVLFHCVGHAHK